MCVAMVRGGHCTVIVDLVNNNSENTAPFSRDPFMQPSSSRTRRKLHRRYTPFVFAFYMSAIMAFLMCATIVAAQSGVTPDYVWNVLKAYSLAMPVAFCCVVLVRPLVMRLVALTVHLD